MKSNLIFLMIPFLAFAKFGIDFGPDSANSFSVSDLQCLRSTGIQFAIIRGWHSYGAFDQRLLTTLPNALKAGFPSIGVYLFPCRGMDASQQIQQMMGNLTQYRGNIDRVWLDIEMNPNQGCGWDAHSFEENCKYISEMVDAVKALNYEVGIYASHRGWGIILGSDAACQNFTEIPLWYPHFDQNPTFDDFVSFGGWTKPNIKQYIDLTRNTKCGIPVDQDLMPDADVLQFQ
ncbi:hypothetical protein FGO68_gene162 [Halteria grandinella]|uniref:Lysozyme n=1 Tax=Halteria grandinella TaxID=5974 RepID=A0A8J8SYM6_HALGN|nr:hypothetical protein FGO68_gene162 [Halteria grandinella]